MKHLALLLLAVPGLGGCAAFSAMDAQTVAETNTKLNIAAFESVYRDWTAARRRGTDATLEWSEIDGGWSFSGTLTSDGPTWTGAMTFDGSLAGDEDSAEWALGVDYSACRFDDVTLDGSMDWTWAAQVSGSGFHMEWGVVGEITASGAVVGTGEVDYDAVIDVTGSSASFEVSGKVGGAPVDFSLTIAFPSIWS